MDGRLGCRLDRVGGSVRSIDVSCAAAQRQPGRRAQRDSVAGEGRHVVLWNGELAQADGRQTGGGGIGLRRPRVGIGIGKGQVEILCHRDAGRSEEHTSELQSLMRISYAVFCLKKKTTTK